MLEPGAVLNERYTIRSLLAEGGMSAVYLARDSHLTGDWVVKEMGDVFPHEEDREAVLAQFRREAAILSTLSHESLPKVIDFFSIDGAHYLVEEYLPGVTLAELVRQRIFTEEEAVEVGRQILRVLRFLHGHGIVYRDVKPQNIMARPDGRYVLIDFGIARLYSVGKRRDTVLMGTPGFAAPEHYGNRQTDERSDVYSLGATLHHIVTGRDPASSPFLFPPPCLFNHSVSKWLSDILMLALEPQPEERFQSAQEMLDALEGPRGVAVRAREYRYPEELALYPEPDRSLQIFSGLSAAAGVGLALLTGFLPFAGGAAWLAGKTAANFNRNREKRATRITATPRELVIAVGARVETIPWESITKVRVKKYQKLLRSSRGEGRRRVHDDTIRVASVEVYHLNSLGAYLSRGKQPFGAEALDMHGGFRMVAFTSELQRWEDLLRTILAKGKLESSGVPGNALADEVYIR